MCWPGCSRAGGHMLVAVDCEVSPALVSYCGCNASASGWGGGQGKGDRTPTAAGPRQLSVSACCAPGRIVAGAVLWLMDRAQGDARRGESGPSKTCILHGMSVSSYIYYADAVLAHAAASSLPFTHPCGPTERPFLAGRWQTPGPACPLRAVPTRVQAANPSPRSSWPSSPSASLRRYAR